MNKLPHICIQCTVILTKDNWHTSLSKKGHRLCKRCKYIRRAKEYQQRKEIELVVQKHRKLLEKQTVINFYGNICANCGFTDITKLTIDHIDNTGSKHRKTGIGDIYGWLYRNNFPIDNFQLLCYNCNCTKNVTYKDKYNLKNKIQVINNYGGSCKECGIIDIKYLTIDHSNNDGAEQRRNLSCGKGSLFYRWLIKHNFPKNLGLQVLCYNCNCGKIMM